MKESEDKKDPSVPNTAMSYDFICVCKSKLGQSEKLLQCHNESCYNESCENGRFFHLNCLKYKRMPNNGQTTWICPSCRKKITVSNPYKDDDDDDDDDVTFIQTLSTRTERYKSLMSLGNHEFELISSPTRQLDCAIIHEAQMLRTMLHLGKIVLQVLMSSTLYRSRALL